MPIKIDEQLA